MKQEPPTASQGPLRGAPLLVTYLGGFPPKSAPLIVRHVKSGLRCAPLQVRAVRYAAFIYFIR
jgi:hypothetical protein